MTSFCVTRPTPKRFSWPRKFSSANSRARCVLWMRFQFASASLSAFSASKVICDTRSRWRARACSNSIRAWANLLLACVGERNLQDHAYAVIIKITTAKTVERPGVVTGKRVVRVGLEITRNAGEPRSSLQIQAGQQLVLSVADLQSLILNRQRRGQDFRSPGESRLQAHRVIHRHGLHRWTFTRFNLARQKDFLGVKVDRQSQVGARNCQVIF